MVNGQTDDAIGGQTDSHTLTGVRVLAGALPFAADGLVEEALKPLVGELRDTDRSWSDGLLTGRAILACF